MHVLVNGVRLFFDVEGASLVPDGRTMREKPTLVLLHGGPGLDHSIYKPALRALADVAQVVYLDHRGNGRSEPGPREAWSLARGVTTYARSVTSWVSRIQWSWGFRLEARSPWPMRHAIRSTPPN